MKITYAAATSLDGFIAKDNGDVSWLEEMNIDKNETGLEEFFASIDGLIMGRNTYDFVFNYGSWPYEDKPTWVCTQSNLQPLDGANLIVVADIDDVISGATTQGLEHLWLVGGGRLASSFLTKGLITHVSISEMPIKLESGIPLFSDHKLEDIIATERNVIEKNGFRQIEIVIKSSRDITDA
ncbi:dihydrofolate reductase [Leptolyngbya cf. ectocarpi LEGE 11479]|uniref:Dihydrofolate reductase n=1 Tax=Leptolyngbya cf. ectocarpi LEGE 11479 TaxID=1828722 RepID=A0A928ZZJ8_LEPEC|nr:dihydrofolate reductase family protein [Leptolyngbya ectocarpi]MBE9070397.1 dihydrofolate reductase [Leptolyngbya cf. ectocarpi LEGE 11479]